ncbi:hypothetical protein Tco_0774768 [Tanacetum coccineum]|uniref:Uncharacterized protein n=1 Tax=Tanacetum coccineum TaxID=301880 RepID=A0ABQ4ZQD8_9ASTR
MLASSHYRNVSKQTTRQAKDVVKGIKNRLGASFPERPERSALVLTPPQTQPLTTYPHNLGNPENEHEAVAPSAKAEFSTLSLTEMQNARGIMDVLAEMLTAIDPVKKDVKF